MDRRRAMWPLRTPVSDSFHITRSVGADSREPARRGGGYPLVSPRGKRIVRQLLKSSMVYESSLNSRVRLPHGRPKGVELSSHSGEPPSCLFCWRRADVREAVYPIGTQESAVSITLIN